MPVRRARRRLGDERGTALILMMLITMLLLALGTMLALTAATETAVAAHHRDGIEALHAADAAVAWAAHDLARTGDWTAVLSGGVVSSWFDGAPGPRRLADGTTLDLVALTNELRCGVPVACSDAAMDAVSAARPWGRNNPRWRVFAHGPATGLPGVDGRSYVVVWVGDDPSETDGDPHRDGGVSGDDGAGTSGNPGLGTLLVIAHAYGPGTAVRVVEAGVARVGGQPGVRLVGWRAGP